MSFTNLLTIAMPCYERKEFFLEALESALNQTVKCKVIVVDNCSSHDYFEKVCKEKNVTYYRNDRNIGIAANFARGFELSETKFVMNLQDDDILSPFYVESLIKAITQHTDIDIYYTDFVTLKSKGEFPHRHVLPFGYMSKGNLIIDYGIKYKLGFPFMTSTIRKAIAYKISDTKGWIGSYDWEWIYSIADNYCFYGEPDKLYKYRIHDQQVTRNLHRSFSLSLPFIYGKVLYYKVSDNDLKKKITQNVFWELIRIKSETTKNELNNILSEENKYVKYLKELLNDKVSLKILFYIPGWIVKLFYKIAVKLSLH